MEGTGLDFNVNDLVVSRVDGKLAFIGAVVKKASLLEEKNMGFLQRFCEGKDVYTVKGWNADGQESTETFFTEQLEPAFKLDFDKVILFLTKRKIVIDSTIERLETLQDRALEARREFQ